MAKRKDCLRLFLSYCKKNDLWFSIYADGSVDVITDTNFMVGDYEPEINLRLGSKAAYEWLIKEHKTLKESEE